MNKKYLYLLTQTANRGYDTHDSCVVCAASAKEAKQISPCSRGFQAMFSTWAPSPDAVTATRIGVAGKNVKLGDIVIASFNAG